MAITAKSLADGQLPNAKGTLYTVPTATKAYVRSMFLYSNADAQTVHIYVKRSGSTSRGGGDGLLNTGESIEVFENPVSLSAGDIIEGDATSAATVDYTITGGEES